MSGSLSIDPSGGRGVRYFVPLFFLFFAVVLRHWEGRWGGGSLVAILDFDFEKSHRGGKRGWKMGDGTGREG